MKRTYAKGRPTDGWVRGDEVLKPDQVKYGDVLIGVNHQFQAENLYIVIEPPYGDHGGGRGFHVQYVTPDLVKLPAGNGGDGISWVWDFQLKDGEREQWYLARKVESVKLPVPEPLKVRIRETCGKTLFEDGHREFDITAEQLADGSAALKFPGYGTSDMEDGHGSPVIFEVYEGRLRLILWSNINSEEPTIIDLEGARESARQESYVT